MMSFKVLQDSLFLLSLPPTIDRTLHPRSHLAGLAICILGSPRQYLDVLLVGGDCCPGDMLLVLDPSWLEKIQRVENDIECSSYPLGNFLDLSVHKAISFDRGGTTFLDVFLPPRKVTYFINEMSEAFDATDVDCAMNGSPCVKDVLNDRLLWKVEMSKNGAFSPSSLVFCKKSSFGLPEKLKDVARMKIDTHQTERQEGIITECIREFISKELKDNRKVVIEKKIQGSVSRLIYENKHLAEYILEDLPKMASDDYIVIETKQKIKVKPNVGLKWKAMLKGHDITKTGFYMSAQVTVCRGLDDQLLLSKIYATLRSTTEPSPDATYHTLETTLGDIGIRSESQTEDLRKAIEKQTTAIMKKVIALEELASVRTDSLYIGPRTDFLDITFDFQDIHGTLTPVLQNIRCCHTSLDVGESERWTRTPNYAALSIIHVMVMRSHSLLLKDKWMLILSLNIKGREDFWMGARKYGVKVVLVTFKAYKDTQCLVDELLVYDLSDRRLDEDHARNILKFLKERNVEISGCIPMQCDLTMLAAMIQKPFKLRGPSVESGNNANEKYRTYTTLWNSSSRRFTSQSFRITNIDQMLQASKNIDFPAFVKFECGGGSVGAAVVSNENECLSYYQSLMKEMKENKSVFELDSRYDSVILTEYITGSEHNIDVVMFDGQLIVAFVRDVAPPCMSSFVPTGNAIPSSLPKDKKMTLIRATVQCCKDIGLTDGVFNVEMKLAPDGPKLIEINSRIASYVVVPLIKQCYNEDLIMLNHLINCGIRPTVVHLPPLRQAYTLLLRPSQHVKQLTTPCISALLKELDSEGMILYRAIRDIEMTSYDKVIACVGVIDQDAMKAKQNLLCLSQALGLDTPGFPSLYFLEQL